MLVEPRLGRPVVNHEVLLRVAARRRHVVRRGTPSRSQPNRSDRKGDPRRSFPHAGHTTQQRRDEDRTFALPPQSTISRICRRCEVGLVLANVREGGSIRGSSRKRAVRFGPRARGSAGRLGGRFTSRGANLLGQLRHRHDRARRAGRHRRQSGLHHRRRIAGRDGGQLHAYLLGQ